ncbi:cation:proton antiporter [Francisella hispaniensis]|uniref:cation:proton antiporter n=1 Tax=Francisella hispaniensis TaxID=622488 RepID=UPI001905625B|nr:cation:proton antiporter [Francisella hispaniensis]MBK2356349.1 cation:proton antiporter [Francisella hispaniensis]
MSEYSLFVMLCVIAAISSYFNLRFLKLPKAIGLTVVSALISLMLVVLIKLEPKLFYPAYNLLNSIDFKILVLKVLLGYLLFAAAMHLNFLEIKKFLASIIVLSSLGVIISTFIIGTLCWLIAPLVIKHDVNYIYCLIVGAIFSPTDPVTVFAVFKISKNVPKKVKSILSGEAMFNDVFSIVIFLVLLSIVIRGNTDISFSHFILMLFQEGAGGIFLGLLLGWLGVWLMNKSDDGNTLIIISLALVSSGSWLATKVDVSEPLTMVITGIIVGNSRSQQGVSIDAKRTLTNFWVIIDELLNAFLFVLVGIEVLEMNFSARFIVAGIIIFLISLVARYLSVAISILLTEMSIKKNFWKNNLVITWAGLRGGVSIALALSIPVEHRILHIFSIIYIAVLLSIFIQGVSFRRVLEKAYIEKQ